MVNKFFFKSGIPVVFCMKRVHDAQKMAAHSKHNVSSGTLSNVSTMPANIQETTQLLFYVEFRVGIQAYTLTVKNCLVSLVSLKKSGTDIYQIWFLLNPS